MKYLGIDYGTKRIGLAVGNDSLRIATPLSTVESGPGALSAVGAIIKKEAIDAAVIGESRNLSGEPNPVQENIEQFKADLAELAGIAVFYEPEFLTSALAGRQGQDKRGEGGTAKSDASAAALILQSYLDKSRDK